MSSRPSAFDFLMSGAKAAAKKNQLSQSTSSLPRKRRKVAEATNSKDTQNVESVSRSIGETQISSVAEAPKDSMSEKSRMITADGAKKEPSEPDSMSKKSGMITADESVAELRKKPTQFDPKKAVFWGEGERVPFMFIAKAFDAIEEKSGRIAMTDIFCNLFRTVITTNPEDLVAIVYLGTNRIAPPHEGLKLTGDASIIKALAEACGAQQTKIKKKNKKLGDLGLVAKASRSSQSLLRKPQPLTVAKVFDTFRLIAKESGKDSQRKKSNYIKALLVAATDCETQYLIRLLQLNLRIGSAEQTLLAALGQAAVYTEKNSTRKGNLDSLLEEGANIMKQVYSVFPVYDRIIPALLTGGIWDLPKTCTFTPGVPIGPMLAEPTKGVSKILGKFQGMEFTCEFKYDGERAQIHYMEDGSVEIYSRKPERNTGKFPDVVEAVSRYSVLVLVKMC